MRCGKRRGCRRPARRGSGGRLLDDAAGDLVADLVLGDVLVDVGGDELLHAELDLALFRVDGQDLRLDDLAGAQHVRGVVEAAVGGDLADVDQPLDAVGQSAQRRRSSSAW